MSDAVKEVVKEAELTELQIDHHCKDCGARLYKSELHMRAVLPFKVGGMLTAISVVWCDTCWDTHMAMAGGNVLRTMALAAEMKRKLALAMAPAEKPDPMTGIQERLLQLRGRLCGTHRFDSVSVSDFNELLLAIIEIASELAKRGLPKRVHDGR